MRRGRRGEECDRRSHPQAEDRERDDHLDQGEATSAPRRAGGAFGIDRGAGRRRVHSPHRDSLAPGIRTTRLNEVP